MRFLPWLRPGTPSTRPVSVPVWITDHLHQSHVVSSSHYRHVDPVLDLLTHAGCPGMGPEHLQFHKLPRSW